MRFVGVAWSGSTDEYQAFIDRYGLSFPQVDDSPGAVFERFGLVTQPGAVIVAADGEAETLRGRADGEAIAAAVESAFG